MHNRGIHGSSFVKKEEVHSLPADMIGVVRASHGIEVQLLQEEDIREHAFFCQSFSPALIMFVATHTLKQNRLIVVQQLLALDLIPLEAHLDAPVLASSRGSPIDA